jgi:hypothetical protein
MPTLAAPTFGFPPAVSVLDDLSGVAIHGYPTFDYICVVPRRPETGMTPTDKPQGVGRQNRIAIWSSGFASTGVGGQTRRPFSFSALLLRGVETNRIAIWPPGFASTGVAAESPTSLQGVRAVPVGKSVCSYTCSRPYKMHTCRTVLCSVYVATSKLLTYCIETYRVRVPCLRIARHPCWL